MLRDNSSIEARSWKEGSAGASVLGIDEACSDGDGVVVVTDILGAFAFL
jgi:hypothetical protein